MKKQRDRAFLCPSENLCLSSHSPAYWYSCMLTFSVGSAGMPGMVLGAGSVAGSALSSAGLASAGDVAALRP